MKILTRMGILSLLFPSPSFFPSSHNFSSFISLFFSSFSLYKDELSLQTEGEGREREKRGEKILFLLTLTTTFNIFRDETKYVVQRRISSPKKLYDKTFVTTTLSHKAREERVCAMKKRIVVTQNDFHDKQRIRRTKFKGTKHYVAQDLRDETILRHIKF